MKRLSAVVLAGFGLAVSSAGAAQDGFENVEIRVQEIAPGVAVLFGRGGNIGVSHGEDGTLVIDDQFAPLTEKIEAAVAELGATPVQSVVNTHWHLDHTGGNENFGKRGAKIFAHENVRKRLVVGAPESRWNIQPARKEALPVVTYDHGVTFHLNGDTIDVRFTGGGHTDGDSIVFWREKNVLHMGDLYFNITSYPFVDINSGGNAYDLIEALDLAIGLADDETMIIPGHGTMANKVDLVEYRDMVAESVSRVAELHDSGMSLEDAQAVRPLDDFGRGGGFIDADGFVGAIWASLKAENR
ncbi:MAG TPA: Zn-dependent hydrolase [Erythrobacter sp.]|nr:Zn-dependent hydrolase [Erythrobacter sp.]